MAENYFGITDTGRVRSNNEDTFIAENVSGGKLILAGVIDGVGGYDGGEVAAAIAREQMLDQPYAEPDTIIPAMISAFRAANQHISAKKLEDKNLDSMACVATLAVVDIDNNQFHYAHVGDTRLYLLRDQSLVKISKDHSFVGFLEDSGRLTEQAAMSHPKRNEINKALGFSGQIDTDDSYIETGQSPFLPGDMLLLCSDGLTDMANKEEIITILTQQVSLQERAKQLVETANANGGKDNITVVLVQNTKTPQRPQATMPQSVQKKNDDREQPTAIAGSAAAPAPAPPAPGAEKKGNGLTVLLGILCLVFLGAALWLFFNRPQTQGIEPVASVAPVKRSRGADELKLQSLLDSVKGDTLLLSDSVFKQAINITDTLHLRKDSLFIKGTGRLVLKSDTGYNGPALVLTGCKFIVMENVEFQDFSVGIALTDNALILRNVQFDNCAVPVQKAYTFPAQKLITAYLPVTTFRADTLVKPVQPIKTTTPANGTR